MYGNCYTFNLGKNMFGQVIKDKTLTAIGWETGFRLDLIMAKPTSNFSYGTGI